MLHSRRGNKQNRDHNGRAIRSGDKKKKKKLIIKVKIKKAPPKVDNDSGTQGTQI